MHLQLFLSAHTGIEVEMSPHCTWLCCRVEDFYLSTSSEYQAGIMTRSLKASVRKRFKDNKDKTYFKYGGNSCFGYDKELYQTKEVSHRPRRPLGPRLSLVPLVLDELSGNLSFIHTSAPWTGKLLFQFQALDQGLTPHQNMEFKCWGRQGWMREITNSAMHF